MKKILLISFFVASYPVFGQTTYQPHIFNDTSLYFIQPTTSDNPVELSSDDLALAEQLLLHVVEEYNLRLQHDEDSVHPKKKKGEYRGYRLITLSADDYKFCLVPSVDSNNQKVVRIAGNCKRRLNSERHSDQVRVKNWKQKFIDPYMIDDGGPCFIRVTINLTLKSHGPLVPNGMG